MSPPWKRRPEGSNWDEFGSNDQIGRMKRRSFSRALAALAASGAASPPQFQPVS